MSEGDVEGWVCGSDVYRACQRVWVRGMCQRGGSVVVIVMGVSEGGVEGWVCGSDVYRACQRVCQRNV